MHVKMPPLPVSGESAAKRQCIEPVYQKSMGNVSATHATGMQGQGQFRPPGLDDPLYASAPSMAIGQPPLHLYGHMHGPQFGHMPSNRMEMYRNGAVGEAYTGPSASHWNGGPQPMQQHWPAPSPPQFMQKPPNAVSMQEGALSNQPQRSVNNGLYVNVPAPESSLCDGGPNGHGMATSSGGDTKALLGSRQAEQVSATNFSRGGGGNTTNGHMGAPPDRPELEQNFNDSDEEEVKPIINGAGHALASNPAAAGGRRKSETSVVLERNVASLERMGSELLAYNKVYRQLLHAKVQSQEVSIKRMVGHLHKQKAQLYGAIEEVMTLQGSDEPEINLLTFVRWSSLIGEVSISRAGLRCTRVLDTGLQT